MKEYVGSMEYRGQLETYGLRSLVSFVSSLYYSPTVAVFLEFLLFLSFRRRRRRSPRWALSVLASGFELFLIASLLELQGAQYSVRYNGVNRDLHMFIGTTEFDSRKR